MGIGSSLKQNYSLNSQRDLTGSNLHLTVIGKPNMYTPLVHPEIQQNPVLIMGTYETTCLREQEEAIIKIWHYITIALGVCFTPADNTSN